MNYTIIVTYSDAAGNKVSTETNATTIPAISYPDFVTSTLAGTLLVANKPFAGAKVTAACPGFALVNASTTTTGTFSL